MITDTLKLTPTMTLCRFDNAETFFVRFKHNSKWVTRTTKTRDIEEAKAAAHTIVATYAVKQEHGIEEKTPKNLLFKTVAKDTADTLKNGHYIGAIDNYLIPFFGDTAINKITPNLLRQFDAWREKKMGRVPARSTIQTHNAALNAVFKEAVFDGRMLAIEVPKLENNGSSAGRRSSFTDDEIKAIRAYADKWVDEGKKEITKHIRKLLRLYIDVAIGTMMRPGKEIDQLTVGDVHVRKIKGKDYITITVRKGKTTLFTGTREVVVRDEAYDAVIELLKMHEDKEEDTMDTLLFDPGTAESTNPWGKNFQRILRALKLETDAHGKRTLYSLRHYAITRALLEGVAPHVVAKQSGHSMEMLERHYSHIQPIQHAAALAGRKE